MGRRVSQKMIANKPDLAANGGLDEQMLQQLMMGGMQQHDNQRIVMLHGDVTEYSVSQVMAHVMHLATGSQKPIKLIVSSYGGAVHEMFGLIDLLRTIECPVHTVGLGKIMSAGTVIMAAGAKGSRAIGSTTRVMLHPMSGAAMGTLFQMENELKEARAMQDTIEKILLRDTTMTKKQLTDIMKLGHDHYISAQEAVSLGIADHIIGE